MAKSKIHFLSSSFWTSLPGVLSALAGLLGAIGVLWAIIGGTSPAPSKTEPIQLAAFARHLVPNSAVYSLQDGTARLTLTIWEVKGKNGSVIVSLSEGPTSTSSHKVEKGTSLVLVVSSRSYSFDVHEVFDKKNNRDEAIVSLRRL